MFVIRGTVTAYSAANGTTNGSISITFTSSNRASAALKAAAQPLTFVVASSTKIAGTIAAGDKVSVKVRAAKNASAATLTTLTAVQIVEQGSTS
jgi:hypothetical protein